MRVIKPHITHYIGSLHTATDHSLNTVHFEIKTYIATFIELCCHLVSVLQTTIGAALSVNGKDP